MGCGSSSASAPGKFNDDEDFLADGQRIRVDKKTGKSTVDDNGKDDDGPEDDFFAVEEAEGGAAAVAVGEVNPVNPTRNPAV